LAAAAVFASHGLQELGYNFSVQDVFNRPYSDTPIIPAKAYGSWVMRFPHDHG